MDDKEGPEGPHTGASASHDIMAKDNDTLHTQLNKISAGKPPTCPSSSTQHHDESDPNTNSFISFNSHLSTQFDNILLAHATNLRSEIDNIKMNLCNHLKVQDNEFAKITALNIKNCTLLNKLTLGSSLLSLLDSSEKVCATISGCRMSDTVLQKKQSTPIKDPLKAIQDSLRDVKASILKDSQRFESINDQLDELKASIKQLRKPIGTHHASTPDLVLQPPTPKFLSVPHQLSHTLSNPTHIPPTESAAEHISSYEPNFISQDLSDELLGLFTEKQDSFSKHKETGHAVISFGHEYEYNGAKAVKPLSTEFPEAIAKVVDLIKSRFENSVINQCLVNLYPNETSHLPEHADNERSIVHGSNIFTVSVGETREVKFRKGSDLEDERVVPAEGNSLYVMSRKSQDTWKHRIEPVQDSVGARYSLTFRYVSKHNENATIVVGDSNTRFLRFGSGKGTFGDRLPGKRVLAFTIDQISPEECSGYKNIFVHCGVNDIRNGGNPEACANRLISKLERICMLCPSARINVSPILPTRLQHLNQNALLFNKTLFNYINTCNPKIGSLDFSGFLDDDMSLLDKRFCRYQKQGDPIHLGSTGIFTLASIIRAKVNSPVDGRKYRDVVVQKYETNQRANPPTLS